jgi:hypothetical protein
MTQVLQQEPKLLNNQQADLLFSLFQTLSNIDHAARGSGTSDSVQVLNALLQQRAARHTGTLVAWAQQQPELLYNMNTIEQPPDVAASTWPMLTVPGGIWLLGWTMLVSIMVKAAALDVRDASARSIITTLTEQLEQSVRDRSTEQYGVHE